MRMFSGSSVANSWQYARAKLVKYYIADYASKNDGAKPDNDGIRTQLDALPLEDHVQETAEEWLKKLEVEAVRMQYLRDLVTEASNNNNNSNNQAPRNEEEEQIRGTIRDRKEKGEWPISMQWQGNLQRTLH